MHRIRHWVVEAHRRSLWQVLGIYVFGSWAVYQIIAEVTDRLGMPEWVPGFAIVLFLIGLPIVLATAFVQEGLPGQTEAGRPTAQPGPHDPTLLPDMDAPERRAAASSLLVPARPHFFLTWQRSVLAGITAFLLLGLTASSYMGLRQAGVGPFASLLSSGALDERDRILVAQLAHAAGDTITADALTEALRVDLAQSRVLNLVEQRHIGEALQRMGRDRNTRLTGELAREVAVREGIKAVLEGEIAPAGTGYLITTRLVHAGTGELLLSRRETVSGDGDVIAGIDRMSRKLRGDIGESLRTVRNDPRLEAVTTSSLSALHKYTRGARALDVERDYERAIILLNEAVAEDSSFAMAWRKLAVAYYNTFVGRDKLLPATIRAYELRDRLTEREKYHMIAFYNLNVVDDQRAAVEAYRSLLEMYPNDHAALNNVALVYGRLREQELSAEFYRRAIAADSAMASSWTNLAMAEYRLGRREEARRVLDESGRRFPQHRDVRLFMAQWHEAGGEYAAAEQIAREILAESQSSDLWRARGHWGLGHLLMLQGRLAESRQHWDQLVAANRARGIAEADVWHERTLAEIDSWILRRPTDAIARLDRLVAGPMWRALPETSRNYLEIAISYASAGAPDKAQKLYDEWRSLGDEDRGASEPWLEPSARGWIALAHERPADAIQPFREATQTGECVICGLASLAIAFESAGAADSAIAYYTRFIETPQMTRFQADSWELPVAYERLATLYVARNDFENAMRYARLFTELWQKADPELQPRVRRVQQMMQRHVES